MAKMSSILQNVWHRVNRQPEREAEVVSRPRTAPAKPRSAKTLNLDIAPTDPLVLYFQSQPNPIELHKLDLDSPALRALKVAGVRLAVPLVSHGELIGLLNLGPRLSEQDYSADDRGLLNNLATQAAPAVQVAQLVRQQQIELQTRERLEQELRVARLIQQTLLPKELPSLAGWEVAAYYQPARAVGGDFYDFITLPDGRLGIVIGDVTDKGVPAALVMATTRAIIRAAAQQFNSPGQVLERVNELLCPDIPAKMFVTCLYAILDSNSGRLVYANAGHDLPYRRVNAGGAVEMRAIGMPLGLMPGMNYEEKELLLEPGENILFYSDGLVEAHNPRREMFSFGRLQHLVGQNDDASTLIHVLLDELARFTGADWEQEDDVTLVTLERSALTPSAPQSNDGDNRLSAQSWRVLGNFQVPSAPGNERVAMQQVAEVVQGLSLEPNQVERIKTAVGEATMNAMEHGNRYQPDMPVDIEVRVSDALLSICITDMGGSEMIPTPDTPNLEAKLEGLQSPRGWGLFLIQNMVDKMNIIRDESHHTVELIVYLEGDKHGSQPA